MHDVDSKICILFLLNLTKFDIRVNSLNYLYYSSKLGILQKMKEGAENVERKIQAKVESLKNANESEKGISLKHHQHWITIIPVLGIFICYVKTARFYVLFLCTFFFYSFNHQQRDTFNRKTINLSKWWLLIFCFNCNVSCICVVVSSIPFHG